MQYQHAILHMKGAKISPNADAIQREIDAAFEAQ